MTRVISGAVLLAAVLLALWFLPPVYLLGVAVLIALLAFREFAELAERGGVRVSRPAAGMATALACAAVGVPGLPLEAALAGGTLALAAVVLARAAAGRTGGSALNDVAVSAFSPLYIGIPLGLLAATRWTLVGRPRCWRF